MRAGLVLALAGCGTPTQRPLDRSPMTEAPRVEQPAPVVETRLPARGLPLAPPHAVVTHEDLRRQAAERMVAAFEEALARGVGAVTFEGQMIDGPVVARAYNLLKRVKRDD